MADFTSSSSGMLALFSQWLDDPSVSEILVNCPGEVWVERDAKMSLHNVPAVDLYYLENLSQLIANENHQVLSTNKPCFSGNLQDGSRVQIVYPPVCKHPVMAIRRQVLKSPCLNDYAQGGFYHQTRAHALSQSVGMMLTDSDHKLLCFYRAQAWGDFVQACVHYKKNMVICGGTSSGKTSYLTACLHAIALSERILTIEDAREIHISHHNQVNLMTMTASKDRIMVSMQDLVRCSLRLRPDRIILGEIRGKEVADFVAACLTGHEGSMTSVHANNPKLALLRMVQMYKLNGYTGMSDDDIRQLLHQAIDVIVHLEKTPQGRQLSSVYYKGAEP
jgi:type IV secretion system protein VirB11